MSFFEKYLSMGTWITQDEARALYKYLLIEEIERYSEQANELMLRKSLTTQIANAEILYTLSGNRVACEIRELGTSEFSPVLREIVLSKGTNRNLKRLQKYFAQCSVDSLVNFPVGGQENSATCGVNLNAYPFYDLNYYSDGRGKLLGFFRKLQVDDSKLLAKLSS